MQIPAPEPAPQDERALREERARLRLKLDHSTDPDIRSALQARIEQIDLQLPAPVVKKPEPEVETDPAPEEEEAVPATSPEAAEAAERLIQNARLEKRRGNSAAASAFMSQAAEIAPGLPTVLEALGDDQLERKQLDLAIATYRKALKLDPKNIGVEEKLANAALMKDSLGSLDDQMRRNLGDATLLTEGDLTARMPFAVLLTLVLPGAGHLALGRNSQGTGFLGAWIFFAIWLSLMFRDMAKFFGSLQGYHATPNYVVVVPLLGMAIVFVAALLSLKGIAAPTSRKTVERPKPPVDLPFE